MEASQHSITALVAALVRAYHHGEGSAPIFDDPHAHRLLTDEEREFIESKWLESMDDRGRQLVVEHSDRSAAISAALRELPFPAVMLARARYAEDQLDIALQTGAGQYALIGAGLDTFAWRRTDLRESIQVFEIDHPATQAFKRRRMEEAGFDTPSNVHFVAADLEHESIEQALSRAPFDGGTRTVFAWLGVTMYLTHDAIMRTLRSISDVSCAGSQVVFDYLDEDAFDPGSASQRIQRMMAAAASLGEPMITGFDPVDLASELSKAGFSLIEDLGPEEQQAIYFHGRTDGFRATEHFRLACASVDQRSTGG